MARRSVRVDGRALENLRVAAGYGRQSDLADAAGVSASTVSRAENRSKETMSEESARQLAAALRVDLDALILPAGVLDAPDDADMLAERVADKIAERLPAIVRAILAEQSARSGKRSGDPLHGPLSSTDSNNLKAAAGARIEAHLAGALASLAG